MPYATSTTYKKTKLETRRVALQELITKLIAAGAAFFTACTPEEAEALGNPRPQPSGNSLFAEYQTIPLPSLCKDGDFGFCGYHYLRPIELQVQMGQARDLLHVLRMDLVKRAVLFRDEIRPAHTVDPRTRAENKAAASAQKLAVLIYCYNLCRASVLRLSDDPAEYGPYQQLDPDEVYATTALVDPKATGHRFDNMPWFWTAFLEFDGNAEDYMTECAWLAFIRLLR